MPLTPNYWPEIVSCSIPVSWAIETGRWDGVGSVVRVTMFRPIIDEGQFSITSTSSPSEETATDYYLEAHNEEGISVNVASGNVVIPTATGSATFYTPEPSLMILFGFGIAGIALIRRR